MSSIEERKTKRKLRVLFLNYEYPPLGGGAANATKYLLQAYAKSSELEVDLITSSSNDKSESFEVAPSVRVHTVNIGKNESTLHYQSSKDLLLYTYGATKLAKKFLKENQKDTPYDVIHAFFTVPCGAMAWWLGRKYKIPYIVSLRGSDVPGYSDRFSFLYIFLSPFITALWRRAAQVVANSEGLKALALQSAPAQNIPVIPNGIDTGTFFPAPSVVPTNEWIITAGATRLTERKGIHLIIEALPALTQKYPDIYFEVMGEGSALVSLRQLAKDLGVEKHVRFLGRITSSQTPTYYQRARVFILPSSNEGMSNALLEALACGLPALVTDTGGSSELVEEGRNGFIIERSSDAIGKAVVRLREDEGQRMRMGEESRNQAKKMSWAHVANEYEQLYQRVGKKNV